MADAKMKDPKVVTIKGRLSFPTFTAQAAYERSLKGSYPVADVQSAAPDFQLLLEQPQLDKLVKHVESEFFPYCIEQDKNDEKRDKLNAKEVKGLLDQMGEVDFDGNFNMPFKPVHEKTALLAPEAVGTVKVIGNKGVDIVQMARVNGEDELSVPDPDRINYPAIVPVNQSVHSLYAGCYAAVTLNLYAYHNGKLPGFSAGGGTIVFMADADRFGGGVSVDEDEMFLDD